MHQIIERDPSGRIVATSADVLETLAHGRLSAWSGPLRRQCSQCRRGAMRGSDFCWVHNPDYRRERTRLALQSRDPDRIRAALIRLHRANMTAAWRQDAWADGCTIWFSPKLEAAFRGACAAAGVTLPTLSVWTADRLRWKWRVALLDRNDGPAWVRAIAQARAWQRKAGPPPIGWAYEPPGSQPPPVGVTLVTGPPGAWSPRRQGVLRPRMRRSRPPPPAAVLPTQAGIDVEGFLLQHAGDLRDVVKRLGGAADDPMVRATLAAAYASCLRGEADGYRALRRLIDGGGADPLDQQPKRAGGAVRFSVWEP